MIDLNLNHIGVVVPLNDIDRIEMATEGTFYRDETQGISFCFVWDKVLDCYVEYITQEGRAENYCIGFNHICYDVINYSVMKSIHKDITLNKKGFRLTFPELSASSNCNLVTFYKIFNAGIIEYNILNADE